MKYMIIRFDISEEMGESDSVPANAMVSIPSEVFDTEQEAIGWISTWYITNPDLPVWFGYVPVTFMESPITYS